MLKISLSRNIVLLWTLMIGVMQLKQKTDSIYFPPTLSAFVVYFYIMWNKIDNDLSNNNYINYLTIEFDKWLK